MSVPITHSESDYSIYPNPVHNTLFISSHKGGVINEVNIYNQIGQRVIHEDQITKTIDVSLLRKGMYVIELISNESKIREKLVIR